MHFEISIVQFLLLNLVFAIFNTVTSIDRDQPIPVSSMNV